jgi:hypothetical protein
VAAFAPPFELGKVGVKESTSKVYVGSDANLAAATLMEASGIGTSLFVINLCASMAPVANLAKSLPGLESYRLYQVARREDGRTRYRLRLGFFTSEADAETVLNTVRDTYPTAFSTCLGDEDRKFTRGFVTEPAAATPPKMSVVENIPKAAPAVVAAPRAVPAPPTATPKPSTPSAVAAKPATAPQALSKSTVPANAPTAAPKATAAKVGAAVPPKPAAPKTSAPIETSEIDIFALSDELVAKAATSEATKSVAPPDEIELSWDPPALQPPANAAPVQVVAPTFKTQDVIKAPQAPTKISKPAVSESVAEPVKAAATKQIIEAPSKLLASIELTLENDPTPAPKKEAAVAAANEPFRVGKGVQIPTTSLSLQSESAPSLVASGATAEPAAKPAPAAAAKPAAEISKMKAAHATAPAAIKAAVAPPIRKMDGPLPDLDTTQTIRALTNDELENESQEKWFAIQLAVSEQPVNLDTMPRLDIFEAYRLYSVASAGSGKITHALRIGFFREEVSAEAVSGYLKTFFASTSVVRISIAEQARFKDAPAAKPVAKEAKVLDLSHARDRSAKPIPTVTMEVDTPKFDPNATGTFRPNATGAHKALATGAHNALNVTGTHKSLGATGTYKAASKSAPPATKRSAPISKSAASGKHKSLQPKKSLSQQLMDEAREVELSESGIRKLPKSDSLLAKMFGKRK